MKILTVVGARPQFIKARMVSASLQEAGVFEVLIHTGQHYDSEMSQVFFDELGLAPPDRNLGIGSDRPGRQTARMLAALEPVLAEERPDSVLVYGDTNSTLAGALVAAQARVPLAHVEAGMRSFNRHMPEEINRLATDVLSQFLFASTETARAQLMREGKRADSIHLVGDVMYDAALAFAERARGSGILERAEVTPGAYMLATIHRAENTDSPERLYNLIEGLTRAAADRPVLFPLHPRTRAALLRYGLLQAAEARLRFLPPVGYLDMLRLERNAALIATDSGGVQKEAFFFGVPCVTLREETEWVELVELGWNHLCPPRSPGEIARAIRGAIGVKGRSASPYGEGNAARRIAQILSIER
jgi:UDP-GlcNAc3NAcA epimerase